MIGARTLALRRTLQALRLPSLLLQVTTVSRASLVFKEFRAVQVLLAQLSTRLHVEQVSAHSSSVVAQRAGDAKAPCWPDRAIVLRAVVPQWSTRRNVHREESALSCLLVVQGADEVRASCLVMQPSILPTMEEAL